MKKRELEITIRPDGNVELHIEGYKGKSCLEVAAFFEKLVGKIEQSRYTSEFYEPEESVRFFVQQKSNESL